jgi:hypothetical protein
LAYTNLRATKFIETVQRLYCVQFAASDLDFRLVQDRACEKTNGKKVAPDWPPE